MKFKLFFISIIGLMSLAVSGMEPAKELRIVPKELIAALLDENVDTLERYKNDDFNFAEVYKMGSAKSIDLNTPIGLIMEKMKDNAYAGILSAEGDVVSRAKYVPGKYKKSLIWLLKNGNLTDQNIDKLLINVFLPSFSPEDSGNLELRMNAARARAPILLIVLQHVSSTKWKDTIKLLLSKMDDHSPENHMFLLAEKYLSLIDALNDGLAPTYFQYLPQDLKAIVIKYALEQVLGGEDEFIKVSHQKQKSSLMDKGRDVVRSVIQLIGFPGGSF